MERVPYYLLCEILTLAGPINEIYQLSLVCKEWYRAMKNSLHLGTLKGRNVNIKKIWKYRMKFLSMWKLYELNFQSSCLFSSKSLIEVINNSQPKVLNLSRSYSSQLNSLFSTLSQKKKKHGNENSFCNVEELRITNTANELYHDYHDNIIRYTNYQAFYELFPNLKRLYAGNTRTTQNDIPKIISGFKMLEFLDLSNCFIELEDAEENSEALNYILSLPSNLKTLFISLKEENHAIDIIRSKGINVITENLGDILRNVIEEQSTSKLEYWLKSGGDPNLQDYRYIADSEWKNPLSTLIEKDIDQSLLEKILRTMIKNGAYISNEFFCAAITKNIVWIVKLFLNSWCNIWHRESELKISKYQEFVPIAMAAKMACETKDFSILDIFADNGFHKLDFFNNPNECNPYCIAIHSESIELFSYLIFKGFAFWNCKLYNESEHLTPLILHPKILEYAFSSGNFSLEQFPFDWVYDGLRYYINKNKQNEAFRLLEYLIPLGIKEKEKVFVEENKSTSFNCLYKSLVVLAYNQYKDCKKMLEYLVEKGFDVNNVCEHEAPLLIKAAEYGDIEMMTYFYNSGANINKKDSRGYTALHAAASNGHEEAVMQLINWGASTSVRNNNNHTALELAEINNRTNISLLLEINNSALKKGCAIF